MYMCVRDIKFPYFYDISIEFWNSSDGVICFCFSFLLQIVKNNYGDVQFTSPNS